MDLIIEKLRIPIEQDGPAAYLRAAADKLQLAVEELEIGKILSKALDLHDQQQFYYNMVLQVRVPDDYDNKAGFRKYSSAPQNAKRPKSSQQRPLIVGFGPAGMFAALELIENGQKPLIFERGPKIEQRMADVQGFINNRTLNPESNIQFGEGGAGSFSDGKLFSRRNNNSSPVNKVLKTFVKFGAPARIAYMSKPHLGTDVIRKIVKNIREYILNAGGEILFNARMTDILRAEGQAHGVVINDEKEYLSSSIYLALGHSARDTLKMLQARGIALQAKAIALGLRIEHPVKEINLFRYGEKYNNYPGLGTASYSLNHTNRELKRGVYTFCMCPGGEVVNASSEQGLLAVNGMSYSRRSSPYSNAALVVTCHLDDYKSQDPLAGIALQREIERKAFIAGGKSWAVPAQNLFDFINNKESTNLKANSYKMGAVAADMRGLFPPFIVAHLLEAFAKWKEQFPLFISPEAILLGAETRSSSPVRILRGRNYESVNTKNLYPIGEGSGYTGGISSSAADAIKAVQAVLSGIA